LFAAPASSPPAASPLASSPPAASPPETISNNEENASVAPEEGASTATAPVSTEPLAKSE
jgi:hypothetical protein